VVDMIRIDFTGFNLIASNPALKTISLRLRTFFYPSAFILGTASLLVFLQFVISELIIEIKSEDPGII
jgi:hypothetical protein